MTSRPDHLTPTAEATRSRLTSNSLSPFRSSWRQLANEEVRDLMEGDTRDGWNATIDRLAHNAPTSPRSICQSNPCV